MRSYSAGFRKGRESLSSTVKMLAKSCLHRGLFSKALAWLDLYIGIAKRPTDLGIGFLLRGKTLCFLRAQMFDGNLVGRTESDPVLETVYSSPPEYVYSETDITVEALSSLSVAQSLLEKAGRTHRSLEALIFYADLVLHHFLDAKDRTTAAALSLREPVIRCGPKGRPPKLASSVPTVRITADAVEDHLHPLVLSIDRQTEKWMDPVLIVFGQIVVSRFNMIRDKSDTALRLFDFAFSNLKRYFMAADRFIATDMSLSLLVDVRYIVLDLCQCLFMFVGETINDHLIVFDWLTDLDSLLDRRVRVVADDNRLPIEPSLNADVTCLRKLSDVRFPDFLAVLRDTPFGDAPEGAAAPASPSVTACLELIHATIRRAEAQKLMESDMHELNRRFCQQMETVADVYRRTAPDAAVGDAPAVRVLDVGLVFVERLFESVYVYIPAKRFLNRVRLSSAAGDPNVPGRRPCSEFSPEFFAFVLRLLLADAKQKASRKKVKKISGEVKSVLFGKIGIGSPRQIVPDSTDFGGRRGTKGCLSSLSSCSKTLVFITSADLRALPLEIMFRKHLIRRALKYTKVITRVVLPDGVPAVHLIRPPRVVGPEFGQRSLRAMALFLNSAGLTQGPGVNAGDLPSSFPCPLFLGRTDTDSIVGKLPFCKIVNASLASVPHVPGGLFVLTYADFVEMSPLVEALLEGNRDAYFMFIPGYVTKQAFHLMDAMFERQGKRVQFVGRGSDKNQDIVKLHAQMVKPWEFVPAMQTTLIAALECPIPLIVPTR
jgi:hypothetical protein